MIIFNAVLASSDSASASIFKQQKRKNGVESETSTKKKTRCFKKCCLNETDTAEVNKNTKTEIFKLRRLKICTINYCTLK